MKAYLQLVNFEVNRFAKLYLWLAAVIFLIQIVTTVIMTKMFMKQMTGMMQDGNQSEVVNTPDAFGLGEVTESMGFFGLIAVGIAALLFYMFFIWYRDWFARSAFVYRLFTLPTARMNVFLAKVTTIMLSVWGLIALQLIVLNVCSYIIKFTVPVSFRGNLSVIQTINDSSYLGVFYPGGFPEFLVAYGIGFSAVVVVFTMVLFERSFRLKGLLIGIGYGVLSLIVYLAPFIGLWFFDISLYEKENFLLGLLMFIVITGVSLWVSRYLLNKKITV